MDIINKLDSVKERHDQVAAELQKLQERANQFVDESKRLQGEFRLLVELGQAEGILDEEGNPVAQKKKGKKE